MDEQGETQASGAYLRQLQPIFLELALVYQRREETQAAYFCYFLTRHQLQRYLDTEQLESVVGGYMKKDSLYCRVNALKALCSFGSAEGVLEALRNLRGHGVPPPEKIIVETLLTFTGDANRLIGPVWQDLEQFTVQIQRALLEFIRFKRGEDVYKRQRLDGLKEVHAIFMDADEKETLEISIIENIQREDLNPIEEAEAVDMLMKSYGLTQEEVGERLGRSRSAVANPLRPVSYTHLDVYKRQFRG